MRTVLNFHRQLLAADPLSGAIRQIDLTALTAATPVLDVSEPPAAGLRFVSQTGIVMEYGVPDLGAAPAFASRKVAFVPAPEDAPQGTIAIQSGDRFLRCVPAGGVDMHASEVKGWELFRPLEMRTVQALAALCRYDWLVSATGALV